MKAWFEFHNNWMMEDSQIYLGVSAYKHARKEWKGFTVYFIFYKWMLSLTAVNNYSEYNRIVNRRYTFGKRKDSSKA